MYMPKKETRWTQQAQCHTWSLHYIDPSKSI